MVAGDVFDTMQPSAEAQRRYYRLLGRVAATGVQQVVVVGGNHDSASRLDAPADVLAALDVVVVGGLPAADELDRCLVPLRARGGDAVEAVLLAVPYVHEFRLGVRTTELDPGAMRRAFEERFAALYRELADRAAARWPGLPILATGHLTLGPSRREDYPQEIHQVGTIEGLGEDVVDPRVVYLALGHVHRPHAVGTSGRAWYCGSPIAFSLAEGRVPRQVNVVEVDRSGATRVRPVELPATRRLVELRGGPDALVDAVRGLEWTEPLPPLLYCRAVSDAAPVDLADHLHDAIDGFPEAARPVLVELRTERGGASAEPVVAVRPLGELTPHEVFAALCRARGEADRAALDVAFATLLDVSEDDFGALVAAARGGAP